jgi:hypothetical protein
MDYAAGNNTVFPESPCGVSEPRLGENPIMSINRQLDTVTVIAERCHLGQFVDQGVKLMLYTDECLSDLVDGVSELRNNCRRLHENYLRSLESGPNDSGSKSSLNYSGNKLAQEHGSPRHTTTVSSATGIPDMVRTLREQGLSLQILCGNVAIYSSNKAGMRPLLESVSCLGRARLRGTIVVDKVVGKAAALLIAYFRPREVQCGTMSIRAKNILDRYQITYCSTELVSEICRPGSDDLCPFERAVLEAETPLQGYRRLMLRLLSLTNKRD